MTREIALHCMKSYSELHSDLCELCSIYGETGSDHCFEDALQYVIEMLEQEPTTKNDLAVDAISRADVLKLMQDNWHTHNGDWAMQESMDDIRALPAVTPQESRKGKWTKILNTVPCMNCPICGSTFTLIQGGDKMHYCPNCGARMVEPQESEDKK